MAENFLGKHLANLSNFSSDATLFSVVTEIPEGFS